MTQYGPQWFWDKTRPEAIAAYREMAEFRTRRDTEHMGNYPVDVLRIEARL